jgi:FkbM family methyltransferase
MHTGRCEKSTSSRRCSQWHPYVSHAGMLKFNSIRRYLTNAARTAQVNFPHLIDAKFGARRIFNRTLRRLPNQELAVVNLIPKDLPGVFIDGGANRGQTIDGLLLLRKDAAIHAFEPNAHLAKRLELRYSNMHNVSIHAVGLSDTPQKRTLYIPFYKRFMFDGLASFDEDAARGFLAEEGRMIRFDPKKLTIETIECMSVTLDSLDLDPVFMKLDVQGHEIHVLRGGERTIRLHQPIIMIEAPRDDLETAFLVNLGYERCGWASGRLVRGAERLPDNLFVPQSRLSWFQ